MNIRLFSLASFSPSTLGTLLSASLSALLPTSTVTSSGSSSSSARYSLMTLKLSAEVTS